MKEVIIVTNRAGSGSDFQELFIEVSKLDMSKPADKQMHDLIKEAQANEHNEAYHDTGFLNDVKCVIQEHGYPIELRIIDSVELFSS